MSPITRATRTLSAHPDLDQLRRQAKELLDAFMSGNPDASAEVHTHYRDARTEAFALHDAQLVIARAYGFDGWPRLKAHVDGLTARQFISAAQDNDLEKVTAMLKSRPDLVNAQWSYGDERRALHVAVMNGSSEMVRLLMRAGADASAGIHPHRDATASRTMASERGLEDIVRIIDEEARNRTPAIGGATAQPTAPPPTHATAQPTARATARAEKAGVEAAAVRSAVERGDSVWLKARHANHPLTNIVDWDAGGLLTVAVAHNQREILTLLLDIGFDPDERVRWSEGPDAAYSQGYPLWQCAATGNVDLAELLLQRGANPSVHVDSSGSPVYAAYSHRQWAMVDLLKRHGGVVTPDIVGLYRETALAEDLLAGRIAVPEGSIPQGRSIEDYLLEYALSGGAVTIVGLALDRIDWPRDDPRWFRMLGRGLDFWNHIPWLYAGNKDLDRASYIEAFRLLVQRCDPNVTGGFGRTALHEVAAAGGHVTEAEAASVARILLSAGARTDARDDLLRSTPLGWACRWGRAEVARILLQHGADPDEPDAEPWTRPRAWAEKRNHAGVARALRHVTSWEPGSGRPCP